MAIVSFLEMPYISDLYIQTHFSYSRILVMQLNCF